jgi:hypothetical protein
MFARSVAAQPHSGASERLITSAACFGKIRAICATRGVEYGTVAAPALATLVRRVNFIRRRSAVSGTDGAPIRAFDGLSAALDLGHQLFELDPRASTVHKLAKLYLEVIDLAKALSVGTRAIESQLSKGARRAVAIWTSSRAAKAGPEIINILVAADAVCRSIQAIEFDDLSLALGVKGDWAESVRTFDYFSLMAVLYFARKRGTFAIAKREACREIHARVVRAGAQLKVSTEETLLAIDYLCCPHVDEADKVVLYTKLFAAIRGGGASISDGDARGQVRKTASLLGWVRWDAATNFGALLRKKELRPAYE